MALPAEAQRGRVRQALQQGGQGGLRPPHGPRRRDGTARGHRVPLLTAPAAVVLDRRHRRAGRGARPPRAVHVARGRHGLLRLGRIPRAPRARVGARRPRRHPAPVRLGRRVEPGGARLARLQRRHPQPRELPRAQDRRLGGQPPAPPRTRGQLRRLRDPRGPAPHVRQRGGVGPGRGQQVPPTARRSSPTRASPAWRAAATTRTAPR